jgi:uncharacterized protein YndB with AHSA1/START domain
MNELAHERTGGDAQRTERRIEERIEIAASAARVFRALTTPTELLAWWGDRATYPSTHWEIDLRVGGKWLSRWRAPDGTTFALGGEIAELDPPHRLIVSWWDERYPRLPQTQVRYEITETAGGCTVTVTHSGFGADRRDYDDYHGGWSEVLRRLRAHSESRGPFRANQDVAVEVEDLVAAEAFYAGTLGFALRARYDDGLELDAGGFSLWVNRARGRRHSFIPSIDVTNVRAARAALEEAGCRVIRESPNGSGFYVEDPFGFVIDVIERREL